MQANQSLRLCEWGSCSAEGLTTTQRALLKEAVAAWKRLNNLNALPLSIKDDGKTLCARQFAGVVEVDGASIEIFPKLDAALLHNESGIAGATPRRVMQNLLWMVDVAENRDIALADTAALEDAPDTFIDLFAFLLARHLLPELENGVPRSYQGCEGDLRSVRGRMNLGRQVAHHWNRMDRIACVWDEFTPDLPLNRVLKCACRVLVPRVRHAATAALLSNCIALLDEVSDLTPEAALWEAMYLRWDRSTERFRSTFDLARRLLEGTSYALGTGDADTFVFLLDMNKVFEEFVLAVLEWQLGVSLSSQKLLGTLLQRSSGGIQQLADFYWNSGGRICIGDAKYKHLTKGSKNALTFAQIGSAEDEEDFSPAAGRILSPHDVRQLTTYAQLAGQKNTGRPPAQLLLLYPFVGDGQFNFDRELAWNGSPFWLVPLRLDAPQNLGAVLPPTFVSALTQYSP